MVNEPMLSQTSDRITDDLYKALQDNTWAGGNILRGEIPRVVALDALPTAADTTRNQIVILRGGAGVADKMYISLKTAADTYVWVDISTVVLGSSTSDLKDDMVANGLVADGGATPLNLDGGALSAGNINVTGEFNHDGSTFGAFNVTPATRPGSTAEIKAGLASLGLLTDGGATPLNLDGGTLTAGQIDFTGNCDGSATSDFFGRNFNIEGALDHNGTTIGFYGNTPITRRTVNGSRGGNAALASVLLHLDAMGIIADATTA